MRKTLLAAALTAVVGLFAAMLTAFAAPASAVIDRDCGDFATQPAAQTFFVNAGAGDPHRLDDDGDGRACETLPCPCGVRNTNQTTPSQNTPPPVKAHLLQSFAGRKTTTVSTD